MMTDSGPVDVRLRRRVVLMAVVMATLVFGAAPARADEAWSPPAAIAGGDMPAKGVVPVVAMDAAGDIDVVWTTAGDSAGGCPCAVRVASRSAGADAFSAPVTVSTSDSGTHAEHAAVAMDAGGDAIVVWDDTGGAGSLGTPGGSKVFAAIKSAGGSLGSPVVVSAAARGGTDPGVAMDSRGDLVIAYSSKVGSGASDVETVFGPAGEPLGAPTVLTDPRDSVFGCCGANLSVSPDGHVAIAFNTETLCSSGSQCPSLQVKAATAPPGGPFGVPGTVSSVFLPGSPFLGGEASFTSIAADDSADAAVGWEGSIAPEGSHFTTSPTAEVTFDDGGAGFFSDEMLGGSPIAWGPAVAIDASREAVAMFAPGLKDLAFGGTDGPAELDAAVRLPGGGFGPIQKLSSSGRNGQLAVSNAQGSDDETLAVWVGNAASPGDAVIEAAFRPPGGMFGSTDIVAPTTGQPANSQQLIDAIDANGHGAITWVTGDHHIDVSLSGPSASVPSPASAPPPPTPSPAAPAAPAKLLTIVQPGGGVVPRIHRFRVHATKVTFQFGCAGGACRGTVWAITKVKSKVQVRRHGKRVTFTNTVTVLLAKRHFDLAAGRSQKFTLALNPRGKHLLTKLGRLAIALEIKIGRSEWATSSITAHAPPVRRHHR